MGATLTLTLTLTLSLRRERENIFKAISPWPPLLKRGGIVASRIAFKQSYSPLIK